MTRRRGGRKEQKKRALAALNGTVYRRTGHNTPLFKLLIKKGLADLAVSTAAPSTLRITSVETIERPIVLVREAVVPPRPTGIAAKFFRPTHDTADSQSEVSTLINEDVRRYPSDLDYLVPYTDESGLLAYRLRDFQEDEDTNQPPEIEVVTLE